MVVAEAAVEVVVSCCCLFRFARGFPASDRRFRSKSPRRSNTLIAKVV